MLFPLILAAANPLFTDTFTADPAPIVDKNGQTMDFGFALY